MTVGYFDDVVGDEYAFALRAGFGLQDVEGGQVPVVQDGLVRRELRRAAPVLPAEGYRFEARKRSLCGI